MIFKKLLRWESSTFASVKTDHKIVELEAKRIRLLFEYLIKHGFSEEQAVKIVSGVGVLNKHYL